MPFETACSTDLGLDLQDLTPSASLQVGVVMQGVLHGRHHRVIRVRRAVAEVHAHTELVVLNRRAWDLLHPAERKKLIVEGSRVCVYLSATLLLMIGIKSMICKGSWRYRNTALYTRLL